MEGAASFGYWIRRRRKTLDLTQETLAAKTNCSVATIRKIEGDERRPSRQIAELLATVLQIPTNERQKFVEVARAQRSPDLLGTADLPPSEVTAMLNGSTTTRATSQQPTPKVASSVQITATATNLPIPSTPFIGRKTELSELSQLLATPACRLLTIVGPGGIGKTRLAMALAAQHQQAANGITFVALAALADAEFMVAAIANAVGLSFSGTTDPKTQLLDFLYSKQIILLLDNIEHLLDGVGLLVEILQQIPGVKLLITSRERLNLQGEWVFELRGLPVPPNDQSGSLTEYSAVTLFVDAAQRVDHKFHLSTQNQQMVVHICQLVEGVPLAIELAATWVHILSCQEIANEIERNIDFLVVNRRDLPERHRSLRAVFDHSWQLLSDPEREALCRLALFRNGFGREAAAAVANAPLSLLAALSTKSLLRRSQEGRYEPHELVRQYAIERLQLMGDWEATCDRYLAYFLQLVKEAAEQLRGPHLVEWYNRLELEHANLRVALGWALAPTSPPQRIKSGVELATANHRYWQGRGHLREGFTWLEQGLQFRSVLDTATHANALQIAGWLIHQLGDGARATVMLQESITLYRQLNDEFKLAATLDFLGDVAWINGDFATAQESYASSLTIFRRRGDPYSIGLALYSAGRLHVDYGYYQAATSFLQEGLALLEGIPHARGIALCRNALGRLALLQGEYSVANIHVRGALQLFYELRNKVDMAECLEALALVAAPENRERFIILWSAAQTLRRQIGVLQSENDPLNRQAKQMKIGDEVSTHAWVQGASLGLQQVVDFALMA